MTDAAEDWGDLEQVKSKRPGPILLFCGLGCLIPLLLVIVTVVWGFNKFNAGKDAELQWSRLEELLPHDARPEGWKMQFGIKIGLWVDAEVYILTRSGEQGVASVATIIQQEEAVDDLFDFSRDGVSPWTPPGESEPLRGLEVQGRMLRVSVVEDDERDGSWDFGAGESMEGDGDQLNLAIDLTARDEDLPIVLYWVHQDSEALTPEELRAFLAPFHIGPER